jgi:hypothetical protein
MAGARQGLPVRLDRAPQRGAAFAITRASRRARTRSIGSRSRARGSSLILPIPPAVAHARSLVRSAPRSPGPPEGAVLKHFHRIRMGRLAGPVAPITERTAYLSGRAHRAIVAMARPALPGPMASPDAPDVPCSTSGARRKPGRATVLPTGTDLRQDHDLAVEQARPATQMVHGRCDTGIAARPVDAVSG